MHKHVSNLFQKEMTRKEFMATLGFGAVSLMGFSSILRILNGGTVVGGSAKSASQGYGSSRYGG